MSSASLLMIPNCKVWLIPDQAVLPFSEPQTGWRVGEEEPPEIQQTTIKSSTWGTADHCTSTGECLTFWKAALWRRALEYWWTTNDVPSWPKRSSGVHEEECGWYVGGGAPHF